MVSTIQKKKKLTSFLSLLVHKNIEANTTGTIQKIVENPPPPQMTRDEHKLL